MAEQKGYEWPEKFNIGVLPGRGVGVAEKWTSILAEDTGMKVSLADTPDNVERYKWLKDGIVDIAGGGATELGRVLAGDRNFAKLGAFPIRAVWTISKYNSGFFVRGDSYIKDVYDIKPGVRVVDMSSYLASQRNIEGLLAWAGITDLEKDVNWVPAHNSAEKARFIVDGEADIASASPTAAEIYEAEKNPHGIRWIELNSDKDPEGARRLNEKYLTIFGPMFDGVPSCIGRWSTVGIGLFCARPDADTEFVYNLAKWMDENWGRYKGLHFWLEQTTRKNLMEELDRAFTPCHDGLIKYLKELGLWTVAHEERQKANVDMVERYYKANQAAIKLAGEKQIAVAADNPAWLEMWENYKKEQGLSEFELLPSLSKG